MSLEMKLIHYTLCYFKSNE